MVSDARHHHHQRAPSSTVSLPRDLTSSPSAMGLCIDEDLVQAQHLNRSLLLRPHLSLLSPGPGDNSIHRRGLYLYLLSKKTLSLSFVSRSLPVKRYRKTALSVVVGLATSAGLCVSRRSISARRCWRRRRYKKTQGTEEEEEEEEGKSKRKTTK